MGIDISGLKYYSFQNQKTEEINIASSDNENIFSPDEVKKKVDELVMRHNQQTNSKLKQCEDLRKNGKISESDFRMNKLEACAQDLIYQLGISSLYNTNIS